MFRRISAQSWIWVTNVSRIRVMGMSCYSDARLDPFNQNYLLSNWITYRFLKVWSSDMSVIWMCLLNVSFWNVKNDVNLKAIDVNSLTVTVSQNLRNIFHFEMFLWFSTISSTTDGSDRVEMSPRSSGLSEATCRRIRRMILPDRVLGKPEQNWKKSKVRFRTV